MALDLKKLTLPKEVATEVLKGVANTSTIARLSPSTPQLFTDREYLIFNGDAEAEVVAEGAKKSSHDYTLRSVVAKRVKVQTTTRVTSELRWADEDNQLEIISQIQADQAKAIGRALDVVVYHGLNPKTGEALEGHTGLAADGIQVESQGDTITDLDELIAAVHIEHDVNGVALSREWAAELRKTRNPQTGARFYPEIPMNLDAGYLDGIVAATSNTVSWPKAQTPTDVLAFLGDFSVIKWGMVRDMAAEIIPYGDPDGTGVDLAAHNQVAYRAEAVFAYAVLEPEAIAVLKKAGE